MLLNLLVRPKWLRLATLLSIYSSASAATSLLTTSSSSSQWTRRTQPIWRRATSVPRERFAAQWWLTSLNQSLSALQPSWSPLPQPSRLSQSLDHRCPSREKSSRSASRWTVSCGLKVTPEWSPWRSPTTGTLFVMCTTCWRPNSPQLARAVSSRHGSTTATLYCMVH